ncbi:teichuronic acid biosynthesis glycosyl transferase [Limosilactobacillus reuteri]|uniref:Teichuronic acid biosynthesis glycosyl transferase n=1 Tax=Limosilactobacillus reuteri TaxID=1598 RepID=A0A317GFG0_LIMRT|nr:teichuronic acid biosynthesis glycosyl transferase [Limosilactobacillus reuteri]PWT46826.1 teichuronic acid biosynthesis glycosyl transferase [Limosilactobacillus reuteri]PWT58051.1 teichuronic acid biosynthesis glycosyl transferase [Limosilactobacillus reuteri]
MTEKKDECGVKYTLDILEDRWQPRIIFWLGFRPFTIEELHQLLPELTDVALKEKITSLQNLRIVNPVVDEENKYSLTDDGNDLRNDDIWLPNFLEEQIKFMKNKNAICVCCSYSRIDEKSNEILKPVIAKKVITSKDMQAVDYVGTLTGVYDQSKYGKVYLKEELNSLLDDYAFFIDVINLEGVAYGNPKILAKYRLRKGSMTNNKKKLIKKHYLFYKNVLNQNLFKSIYSTTKWGITGFFKYYSK